MPSEVTCPYSPDPNAPATSSPSPAEVPGTRIEPYRLVQQLGEGGMGTVFLDEQEEPVKRRVALKIIKGRGTGTAARPARLPETAEGSPRKMRGEGRRIFLHLVTESAVSRRRVHSLVRQLSRTGAEWLGSMLNEPVPPVKFTSSLA